MSPVEQEIRTILELWSSSPISERGSPCSICSFLCSVLWTFVCPFVCFRLAIVLSVHRFTVSDYSLINANCFCTKPTRNDWKKHNDIVTCFIRRYHYQQIEDVQCSICLYREMWSFKCHCNWRLVTNCTFDDCSF
jgi:hypothetical protein